VINAQASQGWEVYRTDPITVRGPPGCLGAFLGQSATIMQYHVITFRRPGNPANETVPDPVEAVKEAARERAKVAADTVAKARKEAAEIDVWARMAAADRREQLRREAAERRTEWAAWFHSLPDGMQLILILGAIVLPIGIGIVFWLAMGFAGQH
jgi:hypothetical protein